MDFGHQLKTRDKMKAAFALSMVALLAIAQGGLATRGYDGYAKTQASDRLFTKDISSMSNGADDPLRISGYFKLDRTKDAHMFFFHFQSRNDVDSTDPVVVWMTGGPGCSSELAVFYENGPFHINDDMTLNETEFGWDVHHNMIFVDQPINTGFSYSQDPADEVFTEATVAEDMWEFLQEFMAAYPQYADRDLYITGESYAGHYVPAVTHGIYTRNKDPANADVKLNLRGFAIGNGLTDPINQYPQYGNFSLQNGLIDQSVFDMTQAQVPECQEKIATCNNDQTDDSCMNAVNFCQSAIVQTILTAAGDINVYDIRKQCGDNPLCYDFSNLSKYLSQESVLKILGIPSFVKWESCSGKVHTDFMHDWMLQYESILPEMLEDGVRGMIYAGVEDFICNWLGNFAWVQKMQWDGQGNFNDASFRNWLGPSGEVAGEVKSYGPLSFVKVNAGTFCPPFLGSLVRYPVLTPSLTSDAFSLSQPPATPPKAGHTVPMDQPANGLRMITSFTRNQPLA